jgi:ferredoxin
MIATKAWINHCGCFSLCVEQAPSLLKESSDKLTTEVIATDRNFTEQETNLLIDAFEVCPMDAIYIEFENEVILNKHDDPFYKQLRPSGS